MRLSVVTLVKSGGILRLLVQFLNQPLLYLSSLRMRTLVGKHADLLKILDGFWRHISKSEICVTLYIIYEILATLVSLLSFSKVSFLQDEKGLDEKGISG